LTTDISALLTDPNTPFDTDKLIEPLPGFAVGAIGTIIIATMFGIGSGRVFYEEQKKKPKGRESKAWRDKKRWKCSKCGHDLPPGKMKCPNCGAGVIQ
ncbi:MAG: zinc ribbon domain-containing protein, partial [Candidatus Hodarchaeales archaeon]